MSVLSDVSLRAYLSTGRLAVAPMSDDAIGPNSIDVTLGPSLSVQVAEGVIDTLTGDGSRSVAMPINGRGGWTLYPHRLYLGATAEWIEVPPELACWFTNRSTLARFGVTVEQAGLVDAGFRGNVTTEIQVIEPTILYPGQPIGQLVFARLTTTAERPYGERGRYQDSRGAVPPIPFGAPREDEPVHRCTSCHEVPE